jgi:hypothetical protein
VFLSKTQGRLRQALLGEGTATLFMKAYFKDRERLSYYIFSNDT